LWLRFALAFNHRPAGTSPDGGVADRGRYFSVVPY
jgi:hypothetical protein